MWAVRRSGRLSTLTLPDGLEQCSSSGRDSVETESPEPLTEDPTATTISFEPPLKRQAIEFLSRFADQRELSPPDLHSQCRRRKGKNGNAPRPPNAFMLFRSDFWRFNKGIIPERDHRQISRIAADCWNVLAEPRRVPYQTQARKLKDEHAQLYPQHKYNLSAKDRARRKMREDTDDSGLCDAIAVQVVQDVKTSKPQKTSVSGGRGLLDHVVERKVNLKRSHSASVAGATFKGEPKTPKPATKKRKKNGSKPPIDAIPVLEVQSQIGPSHPSVAPFVPTNEIPALALPPSSTSPAIKEEPFQSPFIGFAAHFSPLINEPVLSPSSVAELSVTKDSEFEVPEVPVAASPPFSAFGYDPPVEYQPDNPGSAVDVGLKFLDEYGLAKFTEGLDFGSIGDLGDAPAGMGTLDEDYEFAAWVNDSY